MPRDNWETETGLDDMVSRLKRSLRASIVDRALKRLEDVHEDGHRTWLVQGRPEFGDAYPTYKVSLDGAVYHCSCHTHYYGETREAKMCSHSVAVVLAKKAGTVKPKPVPTPQDLGLPAKFKAWRQYQWETIERIAGSSKKVVLVQAPTGSGKSIYVAALQKHLRTRFLYTAHTIQLQKQFVSDFPYSVQLVGRRNYPCLKSPLLTAQECTKRPAKRNCESCRYPCETRPEPDELCPCVRSCPYERQKRAAMGADLAVLNTAIFLNEANYVGGFSGKFPWLALDECDLQESSLMQFVSLEITQRMIDRLELDPPRKKTVADNWHQWAMEGAIPTVAAKLAELRQTWTPENLKEESYLERLLTKLNFFVREVSKNWVFLPEEEKWAFKPVFVANYAREHIWRHADRFLGMSATIISPSQFARDMGLEENEVEWIDVPSTFARERRPIYLMPKADMTHKARDAEWPKLLAGLDEVLDSHQDVKTLVHTVSYPLAQFIISKSKHRKRMVWHTTAGERVERLEEFKKSKKPLVLVSPSMERGIDLPGKLCELVVICKAPFPNLGDPQVSKRLYAARDGGTWYAVQTVRSLVQSSGRGMRAAEDSCTTVVLDAQVEKLLSEHRMLFPKWWLEALRDA